MDRHTVVYLYSIILFALKRNEIWQMLQHDEPLRYYGKWSKPDTKGHIL